MRVIVDPVDDKKRLLKRNKSSFTQDLTDVSKKGAKRMRFDANFKQKMDKMSSNKPGSGQKAFGQKKNQTKKPNKICADEEWETILENKPPSLHPTDSKLDLPVIGSLVYCESSALNHAATEAGYI
uniref:Uncharacterized protein n=1 Tax=Timema genevievae TaxID=629358 RepID=A0A7R9JUX6_TIMGE|nr:unnamed protein product [Timema genevievae]